MALGSGTFSAIGGAVSDLFQADALRARASATRTQAAGNRIQAQQYDLASDLSLKNEKFTELSTEIKRVQTDRDIYKTVGKQQADVAGAGFAASGSALDLLRESASQGALTKAVLGEQGLIEEAGYEEQAKSYQLMAGSARMAADAQDQAAAAQDRAATGSTITAAIRGVAAVASLFI